MSIETLDRASCQQEDERDGLSTIRSAFLLPENVIYLGGNSLGPLCRPVVAGVEALVSEQWGNGLLRSWNEAGWIDAPQRVGDKLARLLGAAAGEIIVADSTSVNLYKLMTGALQARPNRRVILTEASNFPTDLYVAQGVADASDSVEVRAVPRSEIIASLDDSVALLALTHVNYQTGERYDMPAITAAAHRAGVLALWDLSHSAGAVPIDLHASDVDLAVGCGYKYLNGGPGAPAFLFVARRLQGEVKQPIWGWMGHAAPFAFSPEYAPVDGMCQFLAGTPHMVSLAALEAAIDLWLQVDLESVWRKSAALSTLLIRLVEDRCAQYGMRVASPANPTVRGSHVALSHPEGQRVTRALADRGVIGDFRPPDLIRLAITPLYLRYVDVWDAVERLVEILAGQVYRSSRYDQRNKVT